MSPTTSNTLRVPGASLYYQVRGSGPLLLIIQGGDGDAEGSNGIVDHLVDFYTVVTYDRRGLSRSKLDDITEPPRLETHSDDAHRLLATLTTEPALVFGGSLGALVGLDLVAHHPEQVRTLVAHEPPALDLLSDEERIRVMHEQEELDETWRREGVAVAMRKGLAKSGFDFNDREPDVVLPQPHPQRAANQEFFHTYDAPAAHRYRLDFAALANASTRIVPARGRTSQQMWTHHGVEALADRLGTAFVEFPGGHNGYVLHPRAFAAQLHDVLGEKPGR